MRGPWPLLAPPVAIHVAFTPTLFHFTPVVRRLSIARDAPFDPPNRPWMYHIDDKSRFDRSYLRDGSRLSAGPLGRTTSLPVKLTRSPGAEPSGPPEQDPPVPRNRTLRSGNAVPGVSLGFGPRIGEGGTRAQSRSCLALGTEGLLPSARGGSSPQFFDVFDIRPLRGGAGRVSTPKCSGELHVRFFFFFLAPEASLGLLAPP